MTYQRPHIVLDKDTEKVVHTCSSSWNLHRGGWDESEQTPPRCNIKPNCLSFVCLFALGFRICFRMECITWCSRWAFLLDIKYCRHYNCWIRTNLAGENFHLTNFQSMKAVWTLYRTITIWHSKNVTRSLSLLALAAYLHNFSHVYHCCKALTCKLLWSCTFLVLFWDQSFHLLSNLTLTSLVWEWNHNIRGNDSSHVTVTYVPSLIKWSLTNQIHYQNI